MSQSGLDPELDDQVIFQMYNVEAIFGRNLSTSDEIDRYDFRRPNVENEFQFTSKFINSNQCERLAIIEDKYEKYYNDLNVALYGNEKHYTKETCEINERRHEWSDIVVLIFTRFGGPDFRT